MTDKDRYLASASECERIAQRTTSPDDKASLVSMAMLWRELAIAAAAMEWGDEIRSHLDEFSGIG
jgi:hypothetical protein